MIRPSTVWQKYASFLCDGSGYVFDPVGCKPVVVTPHKDGFFGDRRIIIGFDDGMECVGVSGYNHDKMRFLPETDLNGTTQQLLDILDVVEADWGNRLGLYRWMSSKLLQEPLVFRDENYLQDGNYQQCRGDISYVVHAAHIEGGQPTGPVTLRSVTSPGIIDLNHTPWNQPANRIARFIEYLE